ncbi:MAG: YkvA family protein [Hyphomicrobiaceae bacterium]
MTDRLKNWARSIRRDTYAIYLAARDPRTPWYATGLALCVAAYAFSPIDLIPDFIPVLGYLDDLLIVPLGILAVIKLVPPELMAEHRKAAELAQDKPVSHGAGVVIGLIWAAAIGLTGWMVYRLVG